VDLIFNKLWSSLDRKQAAPAMPGVVIWCQLRVEKLGEWCPWIFEILHFFGMQRLLRKGDTNISKMPGVLRYGPADLPEVSRLRLLNT
jgi:hypothetical protein